MMINKIDNLENNYDLSIILPFFKQSIKHFFKSKNFVPSVFEKNGIELILVFDLESDKIQALKLPIKYPLINWKIAFVPRTSKLTIGSYLNLGASYSSKNYLLMFTVVEFFNSNFIYKICINTKYIKDSYSYSLVKDGLSFSADISGSICVRKNSFIRVSGFDLRLKSISLLEINLKRKLEFIGLEGFFVHNAILTTKKIKSEIFKMKINYKSKQIFFPIDVDKCNSGLTITNIKLYDYSIADFGEIRFKNYVSKFKAYELINPKCFTQKFGIIVLIQTYNEIKNIQRCLSSLNSTCDGIIVLDDSSTDGTYQSIVHEKLLFKVQKERCGFDDLQNRNILLDLCSFISCTWIYFIDADETFASKPDELFLLSANDSIDVVCFRVINLWDNEHTYRTDIVDGAPYSEAGIYCRPKMFRNIGRSQIIHSQKRKLHFSPVPYFANLYVSNILLKHYGTLTNEDRISKADFYNIEDTYKSVLGYNYNYLLQTKIRTGLVSDLQNRFSIL